MPHTLTLRLFAITLALGISLIGETTVMTSATIPEKAVATAATRLVPALPETAPLSLIPTAHA